MAAKRFASTVVFSLAMLAAATVTTGCGGSSSAQSAQVKPGAMPEGGTFVGVFYSPMYGHLHMVEDGGKIVGKWRTTSGEAYGELEGEVEGNLLRYTWKEHKIGMIGPSADTKGRGYFVYKQPKEAGDPDYIEGEWGLDDSEVGNPWKATLQVNQKPDPKKAVPDEVEGSMPDAGWDDQAPKMQPKPVEPPPPAEGEKPAEGDAAASGDKKDSDEGKDAKKKSGGKK